MRTFFDYTCAVSQILFVLFGTCVVVTQAVGIMTLDGALAIWAKATFEPWATRAASVTAVSSFILSYFYKWTAGE